MQVKEELINDIANEIVTSQFLAKKPFWSNWNFSLSLV